MYVPIVLSLMVKCTETLALMNLMVAMPEAAKLMVAMPEFD